MARPLRLTTATIPFLLVACGLPHDPGKTSERIAANHELRVGVSHNPPWTIVAGSGEPRGIEPALIRRFAADEGARVAWTPGAETTLMKALKDGKLDLIAGGFDQQTQWKASAGVTQPFTETPDHKKHVLLAASGENRFILTLDRFLTETMSASSGSGS